MSKCIGCGILKQNSDQNKPGYVIKPENEYCLRCFKIKNYNELINQEINAEQFILKLKTLIQNERPKDIEFFYIIDIFDLEGSRVKEIEAAIKKYPVTIVVNKIDLLPKAVKLAKIRRYITDLFAKSDLFDANIILNTSFKNNFTNSLLNKIKKTKTKKYFIGSSNVGKSSIINSLLKANNLIPQIVESKYFNTTLDFIQIKLSSDDIIFDTPGIARSNSTANLLNKEDWKYIYFNKEVAQNTFQLKPGNTIFYAGIAWVDFEWIEEEINSFHFFNNKEVKLHRTNIKNAFDYYNRNKENIVPYNFNTKFIKREFIFNEKDINKEFEISISGLGWFNFKVKNSMKITINIPTDNVEVETTLRKPLV
ncbi:ribosome biogenesis GTPase YqeH [Mesoplasma coleopterae]|uniref:GTP-binding protein YqeH n=1 Tax=Mesoplasma coleopterae TaxID=324078 RepID=A0A2K8P2G8_9MOLU|nr:ribosome biogenesis GTPase YqeH [Mesoplasma coleopterae]ATZ20876.1 GTP-binding protein YqeH [Mesoplasma coleopterae]AVN62376.1 ribosome biogenesis GTPase YqeH [Mesoplasma coleopterae]AVN63061.1 ribosome biogenesis GTPase YqeH [Mesoplasma coleopterae]